MWKTAGRGLGRRSRKGERGATLIMFTFISIMVVVPIVGLAIDGAIVYWEKARLSAAVDSAALSAGRNLNLGLTSNQAATQAQSTGTSYFAANFPAGTMGTSLSSLNVNVPQPNGGLWTITVDATANVPLYFMRMLGKTNTVIAAHGQAIRRNVNVIVVLDRSASLGSMPGVGSNSCQTLIASAQNFTNMFVAGQDELGLITFQTTASIDFGPGLDFKTRSPNNMVSTIGQIACTGYTNTVMALNLAYQQIQAIGQPSALNVIVFFSDGKPDAITAKFHRKTTSDSRDEVPYPFSVVPQAATSCSGGPPMEGVLVAIDENPDYAGPTLGLFQPGSMPINSYSTDTTNYGLLPTAYLITDTHASSCSFEATQAPSTFYTCNGNGCTVGCSGAECDVRQDVDFIPSTDSYQNPTNTSFRPLTVGNYGLFPSSNNNYGGQIRPDTPAGVVNAAYSQVLTIRNDPAHPEYQGNITTYSIGLGQYVDTDFMMEVANDKNALYHDASSQSGFYIYAPTANQLDSAFRTIASQVLRLSQ